MDQRCHTFSFGHCHQVLNIIARHQFLDKTAITNGHYPKMAKVGACERCSMVYYLAYPAVIPNSKQLHIPWKNLIINKLLNIGIFMQWIIASLAKKLCPLLSHQSFFNMPLILSAFDVLAAKYFHDYAPVVNQITCVLLYLSVNCIPMMRYLKGADSGIILMSDDP